MNIIKKTIELFKDLNYFIVTKIELLFLCLCFLVGIVWFISDNFEDNSVYYINNLPYESDAKDFYLVVETLENLKGNGIPGYVYDSEDNTVYDNRYLTTDDSNISMYSRYREDESPSIEYFDKNSIKYYISDNFNYRAAYKSLGDGNYKDFHFSKQEVKTRIFDFIKPVIDDHNREPNINLQWFFNWYYKDFYK